MSVTSEHVDATQTKPPICLVPLKKLLDKANKPFELRRWIFEQAGRELCRVYVPLPPFWFAFPEPEGGASVSMQTSSEANPNAWKKQAEIKFVRLAPKDAEQFGKRGRMDVYHFPDGLFVPNDVSVDSGDFESTTFSGWLRVSSTLAGGPSYSDQNVQNFLTIMVNDLFVEDSVRNDVRSHFDDSPPTQPLPLDIACGKKLVSHSSVDEPTVPTPQSTDAIPPVVTTLPENTDVIADDPYGLKGRCDGVYVLHLTAERCSKDPNFVGASKPSERKKIAHGKFADLLDEMAKGSNEDNARQKRLRQLYGATRLNYALRLIDREFDHNAGRTADDRGEWPPSVGKEFLADPDPRRQEFVTPMLALIIGGAEYWLQLAQPPAGSPTKQQALQRWLIDHGITGTDELKTAFAMIAWNGNVNSIPSPPKFAKPSTSRDQTAGARRVSRRRT